MHPTHTDIQRVYLTQSLICVFLLSDQEDDNGIYNGGFDKEKKREKNKRKNTPPSAGGLPVVSLRNSSHQQRWIHFCTLFGKHLLVVSTKSKPSFQELQYLHGQCFQICYHNTLLDILENARIFRKCKNMQKCLNMLELLENTRTCICSNILSLSQFSYCLFRAL